MKKLSIILIAITIICSSCLGGLSDKINPAGGSMTCSIDGKAFNAKEVGGVGIFGITSITGIDKNLGTILLAVADADAKAGTVIKFPSDSEGSLLGNLTSYTDIKDNAYSPDEGNITITKVGKSNIEGTFTFTLTSPNTTTTVKITNGKFSASVPFKI